MSGLVEGGSWFVVSRRGTHLTPPVMNPLPPKRAERGVLGKERI